MLARMHINWLRCKRHDKIQNDYCSRQSVFCHQDIKTKFKVQSMHAYYEATKKREKRYFKPCLRSSEGIFLHLGCQLYASMIGQMRGKQASKQRQAFS